MARRSISARVSRTGSSLILGQEVEAPAVPPDPAALRVDEGHRLIFTPGFAGFTRLTDVRAGIEAMVRKLIEMIGSDA
jgi:hypothetical protein